MSLVAILFAGAILSSSTAFAQSWPTAPIRIIVGFPAGGVADAIPRLMQNYLATTFGQSIVVENRPGGAGVIAMTAIAEDKGNHTLGIQTAQNLIYPGIISTPLPYDARAAIRGIAMIATQTHIVAVHPSIPVRSMKELIRFAKGKPGQLNFGTAGNGTAGHIMMETLRLKAGIDMVHVPYKGINDAYVDLVTGRIQVMLGPYGSMFPFFQKLRLLAVSSSDRFALTPDLPPMAEATGIPDFVLRDWYAFVAPGKMSDAIARRINTAVNDFMKGPEFAEFVQQRGLKLLTTNTPAEAQDYLMVEMDKWAELSKAAKVRIN